MADIHAAVALKNLVGTAFGPLLKVDLAIVRALGKVALPACLIENQSRNEQLGASAMPRTLLGPFVEGYERGAFSDEEAEDLRKYCELVVKPAEEPRDPVDEMLDFENGTVRWGAMSFLSRYLSLPATADAIHSDLRLLIYFRRHTYGPLCEASARRVARLARPTYLVTVNAEGIPVLRGRVKDVLASVTAGESVLPLGSYPKILDSALPADACSRMAVLFILLHELAHVLCGHLEWTPPINAPAAMLSTEGRLLRRALETHADIVAAFFVGKFLARHAHTDSLVEGMDPLRTWLVVGMIGAYATFAALAELGEEGGGACYHKPYTRLLNGSLWLSAGAGLGTDGGTVAFSALSDRLFGTAESQRARLHHIGGGAGACPEDARAFDTVTIPMLKDLERQGRLRGWIVRDPAATLRSAHGQIPGPSALPSVL